MSPGVVSRNSNGGFYTRGQAFSKAKWVEIIKIYVKLMETSDDGSPCSINQLSKRARVSWESADKAILYYEARVILDAGRRGHHRSGVGSLTEGFGPDQDA